MHSWEDCERHEEHQPYVIQLDPGLPQDGAVRGLLGRFLACAQSSQCGIHPESPLLQRIVVAVESLKSNVIQCKYKYPLKCLFKEI